MTNNKPEAPSVPVLAELWQSHMQTKSAGVEKPFTRKQFGQLKKLRTSLGDETKRVVEWALSNWPKFASEAAAEAGTGVWPPNPKIGFLLKHRVVAVKKLQSIAEHEKCKNEFNAKYEAEKKAKAKKEVKFEAEQKAKLLAKQKEALYRLTMTSAQMEKFHAAVGKDEEDKVWAEIESEHKKKADAAWAEIEKKAKTAA